MKILSIDTSSNICTISILENETLIKENLLDDTKNHSEKVLPLINQTLKETNLTLGDIDLLVCDKGPGSFTGIRIGIATVMSFKDSLGINSIGISSLESLLYNIERDNNTYICPIIDAKNDNVYYSIYKFENNIPIKIEQPDCINIDELLRKISKYDNIIFVGDGAVSYKEKIKAGIPYALISKDNQISSYSLGLAGYNAYINSRHDDIQPLYLRKSQAERANENN